MKIIVSAGGTGGHLYPALALVEYIKTQDIKAEFLFVGTTDRFLAATVWAISRWKTVRLTALCICYLF